MSTGYELSGRTRQKARTRAALLAATRELLALGLTPTVEQAAERAEVSASTAYRYFPNRRALLVATFPELGVTSLLPEPVPENPVERLDAVTEALTSTVLGYEPELRTQLRLSLEPAGDDREELPLRTGRAIRWIEEALEPLRGGLPEAELRRLVLAIRATVGIEALVWLTDVAGLTGEQAADLMRWSARTLLKAALAKAGIEDGSG